MLPGYRGIPTCNIQTLDMEQYQESSRQHYTSRDAQRQQLISLVEQ